MDEPTRRKVVLQWNADYGCPNCGSHFDTRATLPMALGELRGSGKDTYFVPVKLYEEQQDEVKEQFDCEFAPLPSTAWLGETYYVTPDQPDLFRRIYEAALSKNAVPRFGPLPLRAGSKTLRTFVVLANTSDSELILKEVYRSASGPSNSPSNLESTFPPEWA